MVGADHGKGRSKANGTIHTGATVSEHWGHTADLLSYQVFGPHRV
jgi:hypothetical protein